MVGHPQATKIQFSSVFCVFSFRPESSPNFVIRDINSEGTCLCFEELFVCCLYKQGPSCLNK